MIWRGLARFGAVLGHAIAAWAVGLLILILRLILIA
jgi:hypothetical protein